MRYIKMQTYSRRKHFRLFNSFNHPHFSMCANVDLTAFQPIVKRHDYSFTVAIVYIITRTSNAIPEFRYRIRGGQVVIHKIVHPSFTILVNEDIFSFCTVDYAETFSIFAARAAEGITEVKTHPTLDGDPERDDLLFMTPIPWVSFTSFMHPMHFHPVDSVPRFAWGKAFEEGGLLKMPLSVQGHHAVMDGIHMGRFYEKVQDYLLQPEVVLG
ncbi:MAG: CatA-like O-acetyltransferase [Candidatus Hodarchaeota archaeon]